jgi:hypothetical protein
MNMRRRIWNRVLVSLDDDYVDSSQYKIEYLEFLLPPENCSLPELQMWNPLLRDLVTMIFTELQHILCLQLDTEHSKPSGNGSDFYIRVLTLSKDEMLRIIQNWESKHFEFAQVVEWKRSIELAVTNGCYNIMYVGQVEGGGTPWNLL